MRKVRTDLGKIECPCGEISNIQFLTGHDSVDTSWHPPNMIHNFFFRCKECGTLFLIAIE